MNNKRIIYLIYIVAAFCTTLISSAAPLKIDVRVALDSAYIIMGRQTPLHVEVIGELSETGGIVVPDSLWRDIEVASISEPIVTDFGNGRKELRQELILQAFDSGLFTLPPVMYIQDNTVTESNRPALKVIPVDVDSMASVHDFADIISPPRHIFDFLPDWMTDYGIWILISLIIVAALIYIYIAYFRKGKSPVIHTPKPIPPYELAIKRLKALRSAKLCDRGEEKEFYTRLTDILRNYLDSRFGINAMEMTSAQIRDALNKNAATKIPGKYMNAILETADFVKFAKVRPLPEDNVASFRSAVQFVEDTKPTPEEIYESVNSKESNN